MSSSVGTLSWMRETSGVLSQRDRGGTRAHFYTRSLGGNRFITRARFEE